MKNSALQGTSVGLVLLTIICLSWGCTERQAQPTSSQLKTDSSSETTKSETATKTEDQTTEESAEKISTASKEKTKMNTSNENKLEVATLGAGCFWCIEAVLEQVDGVKDVVSGYMGGTKETANYEMVCSKLTKHIEVVQVTFDPAVIKFDKVLEYFWKSHDPTSKDKQGADEGPQYRSAVFYHSEEQKTATEASMKKFQEYFAKPIVTQVSPAVEFYKAEEYHQDYYRGNKNTNGYCQFVIAPKLRKLGLEE